MLRGFGLTEVTPGSYASTASVRLDGVTVSRRLDIDRETSTGLFFDTLTNTTAEPITVATSFGGSLGFGTESSATAGVVTTTSSGDDVLDTDDTWLVATSAGNYRPTGVVVGTEPTRFGDQQNDPFTGDYATTGSGQNNPGFRA